jgi:lipid-binding SYLF domain-containing protein
LIEFYQRVLCFVNLKEEGCPVKRKAACNLLVGLCIIMLLVGSVLGVEAASLPEVRINEAVNVLREMALQEDYGTMAELLARAKGVAIFPSVVKAGLMLGARHGKGIVLKRDAVSGQWYGPNFVEITGLSYGLQIGVQSTALVLVITNEEGMKSFEEGSFTLGGDLTVAAGPLGRHLEAGTDIGLKAAIYSYSMSKGAFVGFSLEGAKISPDDAANELYWKRSASPTELLKQRATDSRIGLLIRELDALVAEGGGRTAL